MTRMRGAQMCLRDGHADGSSQALPGLHEPAGRDHPKKSRQPLAVPRQAPADFVATLSQSGLIESRVRGKREPAMC